MQTPRRKSFVDTNDRRNRANLPASSTIDFPQPQIGYACTRNIPRNCQRIQRHDISTNRDISQAFFSKNVLHSIILPHRHSQVLTDIPGGQDPGIFRPAGLGGSCYSTSFGCRVIGTSRADTTC